MVATPEVWQQLSRSSKLALRWAGAAARARNERNGRSPDNAEVDEFDLLVGILLAHLRDSEPRALLAHVGATAADLLPLEYSLPTEALLERHVRAVSGTTSPGLSDEVEGVLLDATASFMSSDGFVELRGLFGALLQGTNRVATAIFDLLDRTGLPGAASTYSDYVRDPPPGGYAEFLASRHPFTATPVEIPTYKADHGPGALGDDYVDIRAEVDAFAYLLASRALHPPLAVGLFGEWGSGKTYFMDAVRSRIEQLTPSPLVATAPQAEVLFWKRVAQIEFNAWHYVEGDLWAGLVEHVFSELRVHDREDLTEVAKRQRHWLGKIDEKLRERGDLLLAKEEKTVALGGSQIAAGRGRTETHGRVREARAGRRGRAGRRRPCHRDLPRHAQGRHRGPGRRAHRRHPREALVAIDDARAELTRGLGLVRGFRWSDPRTWLAIGALVGVPILVWLLGEASSMAGPTQVFAGLSALLATVAGALRGATAQVRSRLDALDRAAAEVRAEVDARRQELAENVELARKNAAAAQAEVDALVGRERALTGEIEQLQDRVAGVTTGALLSEFLSERVGSVDYRTRLGTAALVQRDFRALSKLIEEQNEDCVANDTGGKEPAADVLNRIILYVDDLDRCEAEKVIDVLQAVHLLLAFPLFVVVVAVDSCWLSKSLADHYPAFAGTRGLDQATPSDYLEKIFQVAFWIDPLGTGARSSMVRGLLQGSLVGSSGGDDEHDLDLMEIDDDQRTVLDSMFTTRTAVRIQTAALSVTATELKFLDDLGPLLGTTPRSIKRFANVYQLLRALPPVPSSAGTPPYEELVAFLLALTDGLPCLMAAIRERIAEAEPGQTLTDAMILLRPRLAAAELARYDRWLGDRPGWDAFPLEQLEVPAERVRRFSFR